MQVVKIFGLLVLAGMLAVIAVVLLHVVPRIEPVSLQPVITNFDECAQAGNPVMESYPRQCRTKDGRTFVEDISQVPDSNASSTGETASKCVVGGCSSQLCVEANDASGGISTCEYRAEYACYKNATCERQHNGKCEWTETAQLRACLASPPAMQGELQVM